MSDISQATVTDVAGIERTTTGEIVDPNTPKTESATTGSEAKTETKVAPKAEGPGSLLDPKVEAKKDEPKADPAKEGDKAKPAVGAPEKYTDFKLPDGVTLKPESLAEASATFKDLGLSQEGAQKLVDFHVKTLQESSAAPLKAFTDLQEQWKTEAKSLPDIGGELGPSGKVVVAVSKMLDGLNDPGLATEFRAAMNYTGAGNHPAFIRVMYHLAQQFTEGTAVTGRGPSGLGQQAPGAARKSAAQEMYPTLPSAGA